MLNRRVRFDPAVAAEEARTNPEKYAKTQAIEKEISDQMDAEKYAVNIKDFINEHYLYLPTNRHSNAY